MISKREIKRSLGVMVNSSDPADVEIINKSDATGVPKEMGSNSGGRMNLVSFLKSVHITINDSVSLETCFRKVVKMVPSGMGNTSISCSRIKFDDMVFQSGNFEISDSIHTSDIIVEGRSHGNFEVYFQNDSNEKGNRFLIEEEIAVIDCISDMLGSFAEHILVAKDLDIFRNLADTSKYGIAIVDINGTILYLNEAFATMHGYSPEEVPGSHFFMFYDDEQVPRLKYLFARVLSEGHFKQEEVWHTRKNGSIFPAMLDCNVILDKDNVPSHLSVMIHDISETKRAEDNLRRAKALEEAANCSKSEFLANVSHELRTPLNSIIGFSEILLDCRCGDLNDVQRRYLQNVSKNGNHLSEIINDILEISMIEAGKEEVLFEKFSISSVIIGVKDSLMHSILEKGVSLSYDPDPCLPQINADKAKFKHIIYNLLSNAVKFTSEGGTVMVDTSILGEMVHITIKDDGIGIPKEQLPHLYEKFYQVDGSTKRLYSGTGLGLALTKKLVVLHEGQMWVESEKGEGTTVHVMLPL